jgi:hypothetical protein
MSLLKITATPQGSLTQREAAAYVGGPEPLKQLETQWGLVPWDRNPTRKRYRTAAIEEAMLRAERANQSTAPACPPSR